MQEARRGVCLEGCHMPNDTWDDLAAEILARRFGMCALVLMFAGLGAAGVTVPFETQYEYASIVRGTYPWDIVVVVLLLAAIGIGFYGKHRDEEESMSKGVIALAAFFLVTLLLGINTPWYWVGIIFHRFHHLLAPYWSL